MKSHIYTIGYYSGFHTNSDGIKFDLGDFHEPEPVVEPEPESEPIVE